MLLADSHCVAPPPHTAFIDAALTPCRSWAVGTGGSIFREPSLGDCGHRWTRCKHKWSGNMQHATRYDDRAMKETQRKVLG